MPSSRASDTSSRVTDLVDEVDLMLELLPEAIEHRHPFFVAIGDLIEVVFHLRGEAVVDVVLEIARQEAC